MIGKLTGWKCVSKTDVKMLTATAILVIINLGILIYLAVSWNPPTETTALTQMFYYPPQGVAPHITMGENGTSTGLPLFSITIGLTYDGALAEETPAYLAASGSMYPEGDESISELHIGFDGALLYGVTSNNPPLYRPNMTSEKILTMTLLDGSVSALPIAWNAQGDYYAYLLVSFRNGSAPVTIPLRDYNLQQNFKVHVGSREEVREEDSNRQVLILEKSMFSLCFVDGVGGLLIGIMSTRRRAAKRSTSIVSGRTRVQSKQQKARESKPRSENNKSHYRRAQKRR